MVFYGSTDGGYYGNHVYIEHNYNGQKFYTIYAHMDVNGISESIKEGQTITAGTFLGNSGNTGNSSGPHLHFEMRKESMEASRRSECAINPLDYISVDNPYPSSSGKGGGNSLSENMTIDNNNFMILDHATEIADYARNSGFYQSSNKFPDQCLGLAYIFAYSATTGDKTYVNKNINKSSLPYGNSDETHQFSSRFTNDTKDVVVKECHKELSNGKACVLQVVGSYNNSNPKNPRGRHYVAAVGYKKGVTYDTVQDTDLIFIDVYGSTIKQVQTEYTSSGSGSRYMLNGHKASYGYSYGYEIYKMK